MQALEAARKAIKDAKWDGVFLGGNYSAGVALGAAPRPQPARLRTAVEAAEGASLLRAASEPPSRAGAGRCVEGAYESAAEVASFLEAEAKAPAAAAVAR